MVAARFPYAGYFVSDGAPVVLAVPREIANEDVGIDADHRRARRRTTSDIIATVTGFRGFARMPSSAAIDPVSAGPPATNVALFAPQASAIVLRRNLRGTACSPEVVSECGELAHGAPDVEIRSAVQRHLRLRSSSDHDVRLARRRLLSTCGYDRVSWLWGTMPPRVVASRFISSINCRSGGTGGRRSLRPVAILGGVRYTVTVDAKDLAAYVRRDWNTVAIAKEEQWIAERRRRGVRWCFEVADSLRRQAVQRHPAWQTADDRRDDLATHVRVGTALRRVRHTGEH